MTMFSLDKLTSTYKSVYPEFTTWEDLLVQEMADPIERHTIETLAEELRQKGRFRDPIILGVYEEWEADGHDDVLTDFYPAVTDGTHRVLAHVLTGISPVYVLPADVAREEAPKEDDPSYWQIVSTDIVVPLPLEPHFPKRLLVDGYAPEDAELEPWEVLMSLQLNDDTWLSSPTSGSQRSDEAISYNIAWDDAALDVPRELINQRVREKLQEFGYNTEAFAISTTLEDFSEDEPVVLAAT